MRKCLIISDFKPEVLLIPGVFLAFWVMSSKYCSGYHLPSPRSVSTSLAKETWNVCIWINTCHFYKYLLMSTSISSFETCSVTQLCPTFCNPVDCSTPGFSVFHHLLEPAQTHVYWVNDAIQPSHPLLSPSPPAFNLSQHQGLFQWVGSSHQVAKVLELQLQQQSFQLIFRVGFL